MKNSNSHTPKADIFTEKFHDFIDTVYGALEEAELHEDECQIELYSKQAVLLGAAYDLFWGVDPEDTEEDGSEAGIALKGLKAKAKAMVERHKHYRDNPELKRPRRKNNG